MQKKEITKFNGLDCTLGLGGEVTSWLVCGPLPCHQNNNGSLFTKLHSSTWGFEYDFLEKIGGEEKAVPQKGQTLVLENGDKLTWEPYFFPGSMIDLRKHLIRRDWAGAYLFCNIHVPEKVAASFTLCDRADLKIWVNGCLYENFTQDRVLRPTGQMGFKVDLKKGENRVLAKLENRRAPWLFRLRLGMPKWAVKTEPLVRLPGKWTEPELESLLFSILGSHWKQAVDNESYYGKGQVVLRFPTDFGFPVALSEKKLKFTLNNRANEKVSSKILSVRQLLDSPRVIYRDWRSRLDCGDYKAELICKKKKIFNDLILRKLDGTEPCPYKFSKPKVENLRKKIDLLHKESELLYEGSGVWNRTSRQGKFFPPMYRNTGNRVIAYSNLFSVDKNPVFKQRAVEGAKYLLSEQEGDGSFRWWFNQSQCAKDGNPGTHHTLALCGFTGIALTEAYALTGCNDYLEASRRIAQWAINFGISPNTNYNSLAVEQICRHYQHQPDSSLLETALNLTVKGVYPEQLSYGGWTGHNSWVFYHAIILKGLAILRSILPEKHFAVPELDRRLTAATNHLLSLIRKNGQVLSCFDPEEWQRSRQSNNPYRFAGKTNFAPHALEALVMVDSYTELDVTEAVYGLITAPITSSDGGNQKIKGKNNKLLISPTGAHFCGLSKAYRWLIEKE